MADFAMEADGDECGLSSGDPLAQREEPLSSVNGKPETDDKENNNGISTDETQAVRYDYRKDDGHHRNCKVTLSSKITEETGHMLRVLLTAL